MGQPYKAFQPDGTFESVWAVYPKKRNKGEARKAWEQTAAIRPPAKRIIEAIISMSASHDWQKSDGQYIPHLATWLRGEGWEDAPEVQLVNGKVWWQTVSGVEQKARELGMEWTGVYSGRQETFQQFTERLKAMEHSNNVVPINRAEAA